jgi:isopenicillin N synthase-like dioxygenase
VIPLVDEDAPAAAFVRAARDSGAFQLRLARDRAARVQAALAAAAGFFARPSADKQALDIRRSPHHRGFSEMHNERDWREQLHLGRESLPVARADREHLRLVGPNQWPDPDGNSATTLRATLLPHLDDMAALGRRILGALGLPAALVDGEAYLVMKLICYYPQPSSQPSSQPSAQPLAQPSAQPSSGAARPGVAAHVDYSLVTLLAEDESGGLELQLADGKWHAVKPRPDALVVNLGEIAEAVSGGELRATPHRVVNRSPTRARVSLPVFVNPPLPAVVEPRPRRRRHADAEHVHRVLPPEALAPFVFGDGEWRRKGENIWCAECCAAPHRRG